MKAFQSRKFFALNILVICIVLVFSHSYAAASNHIFLTEEWPVSTPEEQGIRSQPLVEMMKNIKKNRFKIDSILIVRNGCLAFDAYFYPSSKDQRHIIHSCTKSIISALIGIAMDKGYIQDINQPLLSFFPDRACANMDDLKKSITLKNMLMMASGLECRDSYLYRWEGLLKMRRSDDWVQYVLDLPMAEPPGKKFEYCNGIPYLLSAVIQNTTKMKTLDFARKHLFEPLGITEVDWERSPQGIDVGYGEMWLTSENMARLGLLYLNKGRWGDKQIVPASWVEESTRGQIDATIFDRYGYQWWVDNEGFYTAVGHKGQFIFVVPEKNMVVVFTSDLPDPDFDAPIRLLKEYIIPAAVSPSPLSPDKEVQLRLDTLVSSVEKVSPIEYTWISENDGIAKAGVFKRTARPVFTFEYPINSIKMTRDHPSQVMRMQTPEGLEFSAHAGDIPNGLELEDFGPKFFAQLLANFDTNVKVVSNKEITLRCGTKAYRTDITWMWKKAIPLTTYLVSAYKDGKYMYLCAHPWKSHYRAEPIVRSLSLE